MSEPTPPRDRQRLLRLLMQFVGGVSLLAFGAAVMPERWIIEISQELGFDPFPDSPLTFYLARHLSLLYGFVGVFFLILANDLDRYLPLVRLLAIATTIFGVGQACVDALAGVPAWWTWGESLSTVFGGLLLGWFVRRSR
ncbi:hypothetical protein [Rubripirellula lacrimiformis]|nr:hypothetical protein [Rubripirellula lacrimiformis]